MSAEGREATSDPGCTLREGSNSDPALSLQLGSQHNDGALVSDHKSGLGAGTALPLWCWACRASVKADRNPWGGWSVNPPTLRRRQRQAQRPKTDWGGLGAQICFFNCWVWVWASAYYSYFCSTGFPASCPQRQILRINNVLWGQEVESNNTARQRRKI